jgi:hypothetical protein
MRDYAKITPQFWIGPTGKAIKQLGIEAQLVALYLITNPHTNMLGIYYLPAIFIAHETGIPFEEVSKALRSLCELGFCSYDEPSEYVWVHEMAFYQVGEQLKPNDNRVKGINEAYESLPNLPFLKDFYDKYKEAFLLEKKRDNTSLFEVTSKSLRSQEQEQEQEQEDTFVVRARPCSSHSPDPTDTITVFEHWKTVLEHPQAKLDDKRKKLIQQALKSGYSVEQLNEAITGCSLTPHNMGLNDSGQRYDGLHIILRDANQIDRFIYNAHSPPKPLTHAERNTQANVHTLQRWLDNKMNQEIIIDGNS